MLRHARGTVILLGLLAVVSPPARAVPDEHTEIAVAKVPAVVRDAAAKALPDAKWSKAFRSTEEGETVYELIGADPKGRDLEIELTPGGRVLEIETGLPIDDVPQLVRDVLKAKAKNIKADRARTVARDGKVVAYSFKGKNEKGQAMEVRISTDGKAVVVETDMH